MSEVKLYHVDCLEVIPYLTGDDITAVITDPPYGYNLYDTDKDNAVLPLLQWAFENVNAVAVFGYPEKLVELCIALHRMPDEWITWWASNAMLKCFSPTGLLKEVEAIACFGKNHFSSLQEPRTEHGKEMMLKWYQISKRSSDSRGHTGVGTTARRLGDCWTTASPGLCFNSHKRKHPNEKPIEIMMRLVRGLTREGDTVLDPFMGSGTTAEACIKTNRNFIGTEIAREYFETAQKRIVEVQRQPPLPMPRQIEEETPEQQELWDLTKEAR